MDDPHASAVADAVEDAHREVLLLDAETLQGMDFLLDADGVKIFGENGEERSLQGCRGWLRRLAPESWREGTAPDSHEGVVQQAWMASMVSLVELSGARWLSGLQRVFAAEDKLVQLRASRELGISSPPSVLLTSRDRIPAHFGEELVIKPFAAGHYRVSANDARVVYATPMSREDPRLDLLDGAPFLVQPRLEARAHLRIVTVRERAWICELDADGIDLDWRATEKAHSSFRPVEHPELSEKALRIAHRLNVGYTSQDWLVDRTKSMHFLDLNPAGQWLFLPSSASITSAIAEWLMGNGSTN